ncbi:MAG TPA: NAD(P)-dependent oxidoreductase [Gemmata sp.]|jgi:nucleoside-diphosphate-sugar epimerase|nr:NAD(P)-dependent oxidoreductase [Gemmata sp.]
MNRLLITGATGFLGLPCVARAAAEFEVHAVARGPSPWSGHGVTGPQFHRCDLFDADATRTLVAAVRPTHLLHLAWIATPGVYWSSPENHRWVEASKQLLTAFAESGGTRAVVTGTCAEYDWSAAGVCDEFETPARPATVYGRCKNELREWCETTGMGVAWARLFFLYGPREHPARLVPSVARSLIAGDLAECSEGTQRRDFLHTADVADALITLIESDLVGSVNVGSGEAVAVRDVVGIVARACGRPDLVRLGARPAPANEPPLLAAGLRRLRGELGWRPRVALGDGLRECAEWWRTRRAA